MYDLATLLSMTAKGDEGMSAEELIEIMTANSLDKQADLYSDKVTSIAYSTFGGSTASFAVNWVNSIRFPNCTSIGNRSFFYCYGLSELYLPKLEGISSSIGIRTKKNDFLFDFSGVQSVSNNGFSNVCNSTSVSGKVRFGGIGAVSTDPTSTATRYISSSNDVNVTFEHMNKDVKPYEYMNLIAYSGASQLSTLNVVFPNVEEIGDYGLYEAAITSSDSFSVDAFPRLKKIGKYGMFKDSSHIITNGYTYFPALEEIGDYGIGKIIFNGTVSLPVYLPSLRRIGQYGLSPVHDCVISMYNCTDVDPFAFAGATTSFNIRFSNANKSIITSLEGYSTMFGAPSGSSIYFD